MKLILGIPVVDQHNLTNALLGNLKETITNPESVEIYIIDNGSEDKYKKKIYSFLPFKVDVIKNKQNEGYYYPMLALKEKAAPGDIVGLMHNDLVFYEKGWNERLLQNFEEFPDFGLIGLCGSNEIDPLGGRGGGTMCNFAGVQGAAQKDTGTYVFGLYNALILDSLFMAFRYEVIDHLKIDKDIALCHFYDKIWSVRTIKAGYKVGVLGIQIDHIGGQTSVLSKEYNTKHSLKWCKAQSIAPGDNPERAMYLEAERRFLDEVKSYGMLPYRV